MPRPSSVVSIAEVDEELRPQFTKVAGVSARVRRLGDVAGLTRMGVQMRTVAPRMAGTNRHFHNVEEEWVYVLSGTGRVRIGPLDLPVERDCFVSFPPGPRPHHFINNGTDDLVLIEGGERRPDNDTVWYPDARKMTLARKPVAPYQEPPDEEGGPWQLQNVAKLAHIDFRHDIEPAAQIRLKSLHGPGGLHCQAVRWASAEAGALSTAFHTHERTDEWVYILSGQATLRLGGNEVAVGEGDFIAHPAGSEPHSLRALTPLTWLMGGEIDDADVVTYPEHGVYRAAGKLKPLG